MLIKLLYKHINPVIRSLCCSRYPIKSLLNLQVFSYLSMFQSSSERGNLNDRLIKPRRYWQLKTTGEIIEEADDLYSKGLYLEVYELLNRTKFQNNPEVQWRIGRSLFKMAKDETMTDDLKSEMLNEALDIIKAAKELDENNAAIYKWFAIILDAKNGIEGLNRRIQSFNVVKIYLEKAVELNPDDAITTYILGKWCFEMSRLSSFERALASFFYGDVPQSSYEEAYKLLLKSHETFNELYYIPNVYMLGEVCYHMKNFNKARLYLSAAVALKPRTEFECQCSDKAKNLLKRLNSFDLYSDDPIYTEDFC